LAASAQIISFLEMLKFQKKKNIISGKKIANEKLRIF
jgi:hypothetical protein